MGAGPGPEADHRGRGLHPEPPPRGRAHDYSVGSCGEMRFGIPWSRRLVPRWNPSRPSVTTARAGSSTRGCARHLHPGAQAFGPVPDSVLSLAALDQGGGVSGRFPGRGQPALPPLRLHAHCPGRVAPVLPDHRAWGSPVLPDGAFGRVWCGWACPQTVFLDHVYRPIERWIDGDAVQRRALAAAPWTAGKVLAGASQSTGSLSWSRR